jgi:elongation factor 2
MGEKMVDRVTRLMKDPSNIRNIGICAHIDHGKTTLSDNLLFGAGMMSEDLAGKACALDFHEDEQERGITIDSANVNMVHEIGDKEYLINLIDTPGHVDFGGDVTRAMRAVDGAMVLVDAVEGIMPQTETVLRQALKERVKPILFINKVDRLIKELQLTPEQMQEKFMKTIASVNKFIRNISPKEFKDEWTVNVQDGTVGFGSAFHNWALSVPFMQKSGITFKDIIDAYDPNDDQKRIELARRAPLHKVVLNMVVDHLPSPSDAQKYRIPKIWHGDLECEEGKSLVSCNPNGPLFFSITKVVVDPQAGEISAGRMFSGTMKRGMAVYLNQGKQNLRVQQVYIYNGSKKEIVDNVPAGNIVGVAGLKAAPGETVTLEETEPFEKLSHIFEPVVTKAIEALRPSDLPKLIDVLKVVQKEDPSIVIELNEETGEHLMHGMGELHLEIIENRIKSEKKIDIKTSNPIVVYRETVTKPSETGIGKSPNKHNSLFFKVEPISKEMSEAIKSGDIPEGRIKKKDLVIRDKFVELGMNSKEALKVKDVYQGNVFVEATRGQVHIGEILEMVLDMFEDVMRQGGVAREPCFKMKVTMVDCKLHEDAIHRGPAQLYPAVRNGIRAAITLGAPLLYEPIQTLLFESPDEFMGEISKLISNKRGQLLEMTQEGVRVLIKGKMPVAESFGLSNDLRSATGGRGTSSMIDQTFERMPSELQEKIIKQIRDRKGLSEAQ